MHFTCAVIYMKHKKIKYYNSLLLDNVNRQSFRHKIKMQEERNTSSFKGLLAKQTYERKA
jgi:hypothetical protein